MLKQLADTLKRFPKKVAEAFPAIVGNAAGAVLSFLDKAVGVAAERTWSLFFCRAYFGMVYANSLSLFLDPWGYKNRTFYSFFKANSSSQFIVSNLKYLG